MEYTCSISHSESIIVGIEILKKIFFLWTNSVSVETSKMFWKLFSSGENPLFMM